MYSSYSLTLVAHKTALISDKAKSLEEAKTIMVVGQTGSGKTTVIDAIFNYVKDVKWEDNFRWKLTDLSSEEQKRQADETIAQTEWVTVYTIPKLSDRVPFRLNLIDTPGFGDTRGVEHDKKLISHMFSFFNHCEGNHGIVVLDAVCFVVKAPDVRLTETQKYIFHSVLSIFGKDISDNMFLFATFADTGVPKVYKALKKENILIADKLRFNNSVLFSGCGMPDDIEYDDEDDEELDVQKVFWDMGTKSFDKFFRVLLTKEPTSTEMTRSVLRERHRIQFLLDDMKSQIKKGVQHMQCLHRENSVLKKHLKEMEENKNFSMTLETMQPTEVNNRSGTNALHCKTCNATCHYPCVKFKLFKYFCQAFTSAGFCSVCQKRTKGNYQCTMADHEFRDSHIEETVETQIVTYEDIRIRHEKAKGKQESAVDVLDGIALQYKQTKTEVDRLIDEAHQCYMKLNEISLRENPLYKSDFIDHLIQQEESAKMPGYMGRMKILCNVKQEAMYVETAKDKRPVLESIRTMDDMKDYLKVTKAYPTKTGSSESN